MTLKLESIFIINAGKTMRNLTWREYIFWNWGAGNAQNVIGMHSESTWNLVGNLLSDLVKKIIFWFLPVGWNDSEWDFDLCFFSVGIWLEFTRICLDLLGFAWILLESAWTARMRSECVGEGKVLHLFCLEFNLDSVEH